MITKKNELKRVLEMEYNLYDADYKFGGLMEHFKRIVLRDRRYKIWIWQKWMRKAMYYRYTDEGLPIWNKLIYLIYAYKRNKLGERLGFDFNGIEIAEGLQIYHANIVINSRSKIGKNLHLHGENVIGNDGLNIEACPVIGDNVMMGAGAKIFGGVKIANNIKVAAGAIVVSSFTEEGITIGGVPAKKIK